MQAQLHSRCCLLLHHLCAWLNLQVAASLKLIHFLMCPAKALTDHLQIIGVWYTMMSTMMSTIWMPKNRCTCCLLGQ